VKGAHTQSKASLLGTERHSALRGTILGADERISAHFDGFAAWGGNPLTGAMGLSTPGLAVVAANVGGGDT
jgi:hypothetical protein